MSDYSALERLLGLPEGSTEGSSESKLTPMLTDGVKDKTSELEERMKTVDTLDNLSSTELTKNGFSMEVLENDKVTLRNEAYEVYHIAKSILKRFKEDIDERVDIGDRMYTAGGKIIDSVTGSIDKLNNMLMKFRQEEELKGLAILQEDNNNSSKEMSPQDWMNFVNEVRDKEEDDDIPDGVIQDAEIIDESGDNIPDITT